MAFGVVPNGSLNRIYVGTTAMAVTTPVGALQGWEYGGEADTSEEEFYNDFASIITVGEPKMDGTYSGKWAMADSGLNILLAAFKAQTIIYGAWQPNTDDGESMAMRVSRFRMTGGGRSQAAGFQFSIVQAGEPEDVGDGLDGVA